MLVAVVAVGFGDEGAVGGEDGEVVEARAVVLGDLQGDLFAEALCEEFVAGVDEEHAEEDDEEEDDYEQGFYGGAPWLGLGLLQGFVVVFEDCAPGCCEVQTTLFGSAFRGVLLHHLLLRIQLNLLLLLQQLLQHILIILLNINLRQFQSTTRLHLQTLPYRCFIPVISLQARQDRLLALVEDRHLSSQTVVVNYSERPNIAFRDISQTRQLFELRSIIVDFEVILFELLLHHITNHRGLPDLNLPITNIHPRNRQRRQTVDPQPINLLQPHRNQIHQQIGLLRPNPPLQILPLIQISLQLALIGILLNHHHPILKALTIVDPHHTVCFECGFGFGLAFREFLAVAVDAAGLGFVHFEFGDYEADELFGGDAEGEVALL